MRQRPGRKRRDERIRHPVGDLIEIGRIGHVATIPRKAGPLGVVSPGRIEADDEAVVVNDLKPAADVHGGGRQHLAVLHDRELGGAAADVDIEDALPLGARHRGGAGAVGREHRFHVMAGRGADEIAALFRHDAGDRLGVLAPQGFAGENDGAGVDAGRIDAGGVVGIVDDGAEPGLVDVRLAAVGCKGDARLKQRFARHDEVAAGQVLAETAQIDPRKDHLSTGRSDIDADGHEGDVVGNPDRIFLQRAFVGKIVVVVRKAVVGMREVEAVDVVGEGMAALRFGLVGIRHQERLQISACHSMHYALIH